MPWSRPTNSSRLAGSGGACATRAERHSRSRASERYSVDGDALLRVLSLLDDPGRLESGISQQEQAHLDDLVGFEPVKPGEDASRASSTQRIDFLLVGGKGALVGV